MTVDIDTGSRKEQRKFGLVMAAALVLLGLLRWALRGFAAASTPTWLWGAALVFFGLGLAFPPALGPVFRAWMALAHALNWLMTRVMLTLVFYGMVTPTRGLMRLFSGDPLKREWLPPGQSYWEAPEAQPETLDAYKNQF